MDAQEQNLKVKKANFKKWFISIFLFAFLGIPLALRAVAYYVDQKQNRIYEPATDASPGNSSDTTTTIPPLHSTLSIADLHADSLLWNRDLLQQSRHGHVDVPRLQKGNVTLQVFGVVTKTPRRITYEMNDSTSDNITILSLAQWWPFKTWNSLSERALYQAKRFSDFVNNSSGQLRFIKTKSDLQKLLDDRKKDPKLVGGILSLEGSHAFEGKLEVMDQLKASGFRVLAPTHLADSEMGGSSTGQKGGLTDLGKEWVKKMNQQKLIIDLAHASEKTIMDVLALTDSPPIVSHTGLNGACPSNRNLSDESLRAIVEKGGLIGIGFWAEVTCGTSPKDIAKTIMYMRNLVGVYSIALGSDYDGFVGAPFDTAHLHVLTAELLKSGFTEDEIRMIMGENAINFFLNHLPD